ncbi:hydroxyisourate hydrolase [Actinocorallia sp. A-T 12471]|uniref:hydroxyisourate hydrolase n=1 Tax=Actinocorallia sp. A-T 12471 TaxID=3089813 RepID=UPI0029CECAAB|nr:hydroxyisourate hydrolase [Actinocorallia sp. A-T 12471]MDX6744751.1 hydroxyisourate hydrolase [Actinocorallia sp. A-T 12471]
MSITITVVDTVRGRPAREIPARLDSYDGTTWSPAGEDVTDASGRIVFEASGPGPFRARLGVGQYFQSAFPEVQVIFDPSAGRSLHVHLAPHAYTATVVAE